MKPYLRRMWILLCLIAPARGADFQRDVAPVLTKYCAGCHNRQDREGELSVQGLSDLAAGGEHGPVLVPGDSGASRLIQVLIGAAEPSMPPEGEVRPSQAELAPLRAWIDAGAMESPAEVPSTSPFAELAPSAAPKPITAVAIAHHADFVAVGRFQNVDLMTADQRLIHRLTGHPGKVNAISFHPNDATVLIGTGVNGVSGEVWIWDTQSGRLLRTLKGHDDAVYAVAPSPDGRWLATAGYDRQIRIWDLGSGTLTQTLHGHNGPVFDLSFGPDSRILASASADATVKVWDTRTGQRLDTLSQPLKEQLSVEISPDGKWLVAAGADNRIRVWQLISIDQPRINPLRMARYAHEQAVLSVRFSPDGNRLVSVSADRTLKIWSADELQQLAVYPQPGDVAEALAVSPASQVLVGRMDGSLATYPLNSSQDDAPNSKIQSPPSDAAEVASTPETRTESVELAEQEPNGELAGAQPIELPARITGKISAGPGESQDLDVFRFAARRGEAWTFEVKAARSGSSLDSRIRILDARGMPVPRVLLRAVRDSYFTFRGKDSSQTGDFRLHNWEEMQLNQLLYCDGEVVKLYHYPRGPDSGFNVYPNFGKRHGFFDTTPITHALQEPCYVVEPYPPGTPLPPNGLPVFAIDFENDDESQGRFGADSVLSFTAPEDGVYYCLLDDVRQLSGDDFGYELSVRRPAPDFHVKLLNDKLAVPQGAGRKFGVELERIDGFQGEVVLEIEGIPPGYGVTSPLVIEAGQFRAWGTVYALPSDERPVLPEELRMAVFATAHLPSGSIRRQVGQLGPIEAQDAPKLAVEFSSGVEGVDPQVIQIEAGKTATALIRIRREGHTDRVGFGSEEAVVNAPHGVYVGNIGLNGVLITEEETERTVFLKAEPWVAPQERPVFVEANAHGNPTSYPILIRVVPPRGAPSGGRASGGG